MGGFVKLSSWGCPQSNSFCQTMCSGGHQRSAMLGKYKFWVFFYKICTSYYPWRAGFGCRPHLDHIVGDESAPPKKKMFLWVAILDKIMHNVNRTRRGLSNDPWCYLCDEGMKGTEHILWSYPEAWSVSQPFLSNEHGGKGYNSCFKDCVLTNIKDNEVDKEWQTTFGIIWYIWKWRSKRLFDQWKWGRWIRFCSWRCALLSTPCY